MSIFFTSDLHLDHKNIIRLSNRPFSSIEEMNEMLILPDYTHDWRLAGELLEEIPGACVARNGIDAWYCGSRLSDYITPQRAICEAWLEWKADE